MHTKFWCGNLWENGKLENKMKGYTKLDITKVVVSGWN
jgi:hypothetical protein